MGGAQPLAVTMNDGVAICIDCDPRAHRTAASSTATSTCEADSPRRTRCELAAEARDARRPLSIGLLGNAAELVPAAAAPTDAPIDIVTDQTSRARPAGLPADRRRLRRHGRPTPRDEARRVHRRGPASRWPGTSRRWSASRTRAPRSSTTATRSAARPSWPATSGPSTSPASCPPTSGRCSARARARSAGRRCPATRRTSPPPTRPCSTCSRRTSRWPAGSSWPASGSHFQGLPRASAGSATASATRPASASTSMVAAGELSRADRHRPRPPRLRLGRLARTARPRRCSTAPTRSPTGRCSTPWSTSPPARPGSPSTTAAASASAARSTPARCTVADGTALAGAEDRAGCSPTTPAWASSGTSTPGYDRADEVADGARRPRPDAGGRVTATAPTAFDAMWAELAPIGRDAGTGGYRRYAWTGADARLPRPGSAAQAAARGLTYETDRNGNQWAWWGDPAAGDAVVTGSHLDSVPDGGAFDGPLGVVVRLRRARRAARPRASRPRRPLGVVNFGDEEGARFGVACVGSRLIAGRARRRTRPAALRDADGVTLAEAMERGRARPGRASAPTPSASAGIGAFVELHVEQGRGLDRPRRPGRRRLRDLAARPLALRLPRRGQPRRHHPARGPPRPDARPTPTPCSPPARRPGWHGALATFGKVARRAERRQRHPLPGPRLARRPGRRRGDARRACVAEIERPRAERGRARRRPGSSVVRESLTPVVEFDARAARPARPRCSAARPGPADRRRTRRGHPVRAPSRPRCCSSATRPGVSHSPAEYAAEDDCLAGVAALADVLEELACR